MRSRSCRLCGRICPDLSPSSCSRRTPAIQAPPSFTPTRSSTLRWPGVRAPTSDDAPTGRAV